MVSKSKSVFTGRDAELVWDESNADMDIWTIGALRQEAQEKQRREETVRRKAIAHKGAVYALYRDFIRGAR